MVKSAVNAGATHIKIQHINPEILNYRPRHEEGLIINGQTKKYQLKGLFLVNIKDYLDLL